MIQLKQKLILIFGVVVFLTSVYFIGKNIPVVYSAANEISYFEGGYFRANNGIFGGPSCGIIIRSDGTKRPGINGNFTEDSACKRAYGSNFVAGTKFSNFFISETICTFSSNNFRKVECITPLKTACAAWNNGVCEKIETSLLQGGNKNNGQMPTKPEKFIIKMLVMILSFMGGIALILVILAGYKIVMSKGKPEAVQQGKEQLSSAIVGLIFVIFSFVVIELIFVEILKIPGFIK